jgi:dolichol-phosphate mannosyltransferase
MARADSRIRILDLSRNFGHQLAITAGTDVASGDVVIVMDADLQDPPEVINEMLRKYEQGYDVVYGLRASRSTDTAFKRWTAQAFYWLMRTAIHRELPANVGDFRLMSRQVVAALGELREQHRFVRGMVTWLGFRQTSVEFERPARAAGETKYPLRKMLIFAWNAITSFSGLPLRMGLAVGLIMLALSFAYAGFAAFQALVLRITVPGWASLVCLNIGSTGMIIAMLGLIGDYVARIYEEMKGRPLYVVREATNFDTGVLQAVSRRMHPELRLLSPDLVKAPDASGSPAVFGRTETVSAPPSAS